MNIIIFKFIGALGLILISIGVLLKNRKYENILYIVGGIFLEVYSIHIRDSVFITLQIVFILSATFDLFRIKNSK